VAAVPSLLAARAEGGMREGDRTRVGDGTPVDDRARVGPGARAAGPA
jgi:hypothetical protein